MRRMLVVAAVTAAIAGPAVPARAGGFCVAVPVTQGSGVRVVLEKACFRPTILRIEPGAEVTWVNRDPEAHTVTGAQDAWGTGHREVAPRKSVTFRFDRAGVYPYSCLLHPGMIGAVVVGDGVGAATGRGVQEVKPAAASRAAPEPQGERGAPWVGVLIGVAAVAAVAGYVMGRAREKARA